MTNILEREIEKELKRRVKEAGGETRKVQWIGRNGAPDRLVLIPGRTPVYCELKKPKDGKLSALQKLDHKALKKGGCKVLVIWTMEDIEKVFA